MLTLDLARSLSAAGLHWTPTRGDRFHVPDRDLDDAVFVLSDMVIESVRAPDGRELLAFNGTTEWALDSLEASEALWLPREEQLRTALGPAFGSLAAVPDPTSRSGTAWAVVVERGDRTERVVDVDAECALARALLVVLDPRS